jgi:hypothetical protein
MVINVRYGESSSGCPYRQAAAVQGVGSALGELR